MPRPFAEAVLSLAALVNGVWCYAVGEKARLMEPGDRAWLRLSGGTWTVEARNE